MYNSLSDTLSIQKLTTYLRLARTEGVGVVRYHQLLNKYKTPDAALDALPSLKRSKSSTKPFIIPSVLSIMNEIEKTWEYSGQFILHGFADYPPLLAALDDAPPVLTVLGNPKLLLQRNVAIVGARNASIHGVKIAESLAADLSAHNIGVTSGLARGIDRAAHKGALYTGFTIAAIACGIDVTYPNEHKELQNEIAIKGVIISEFPIGTTPQAMHFPRRNRLIAGLCWGCVVIEAANHSGSLITSKLALDYNKPIFAVPGSPLDARCRGSNNLLRMGAILTESAADIIPELPLINNDRIFIKKEVEAPIDLFSNIASDRDALKTPDFSSDEINTIEDYILSLLSSTPTPVDVIIRNNPYQNIEVLSTLTLLEISNKVSFQHTGYVLTLE